MKLFLRGLRPKASIGRFLWLGTMLILVVFEAFRFKRILNISRFDSLPTSLDMTALLLLIPLGLLAVLPTLYYDVLLNKKLQTNFPRRNILENSWIVNTFNHFIGVPTITDRALRLAFWDQEKRAGKTLGEITSFIPYMLSGLSFFSILTFILSFVCPLVGGLRFLPWFLLLSSFSLPILSFLFGKNEVLLSAKLGVSDKLSLFLISFLEHGLAFVIFLEVGRLIIASSVPVFPLLAIYLFAYVLGRISFIPGGIGSFDLIAMTSLSLYGVRPEEAFLWLLLFRLVYHLVPFLVSLVLLIDHHGNRLSQKYNDIPRNLFLDLLLLLSVFLTRFFGIFLVLSALVPQSLSSVAWLKALNPIHGQLLWQFPSIILGLCFILIARALNDRVERIFKIALIWIAITFVYINILSISWFASFLLVLVFLAICAVRPLLKRQQFIYSWEDRTKDALLIFLLLIVLLTLAGVLLPYRSFQGHHVIALRYYLYHLGLILFGTSLVTLFYLILVRLLNGKRRLPGEAFEVQRYKDILEQFYGNEAAGLAFIGDKRLYWYQVDGNDKMVFQFGISNKKCIIMGEPVGNLVFQEEALAQFMTDADALNYELVFYQVGQDLTLLLHDYGYDFMKAGEEAKINLKTFSISGRKRKNFRNILNQVEKSGYNFKIIAQPHSQEILDQLSAISEIWLKGRKEKGFSLGYFDEKYLQEGPLAIVSDTSGKIVAYASLMNNGQDDIATIDLMRYDESCAPIGVMDYLFLNLFLHFQEMEYAYFSMGLAPLSNVGQEKQSFVQERIAYFVYHLGSHFYSFDGLRRYKQKFGPEWRSLYICYSRHSWLLYNMLALQIVHQGQEIED